MLFCTKCGVKLLEDSRFCHRCGTQVPDEALADIGSAPASAPPGTPPTDVAACEGPPAATAVPQTTAETPPAQGAGASASVADNAVAGGNVVSFTGVSDILNVVEGLAHDPQQANKAGVDPSTAQSLQAKMKSAFDFLAKEHSALNRLGQTMGIMKRASEALMKRQMPTEVLAQAKPETWLATVELTGPEAELHNLCARQADLRQGLQTRLMRTCQSCQHQQIVNPEYEKMVQQKKQMDGMMLMQRNALMAWQRMKGTPNFVCRRCQGLQFSDRTIVLCPQCGTPDTDVLLGKCAKCGYDFPTRTAAPVDDAAVQPPPKAEEQPAPSASAPQKAAGQEQAGKVLSGKCVDCGNAFRIPLSKIPPQGLKGKCSQCGRQLIIRPPHVGR